MPAEEKRRGAPRKTQRAAPYAKTHVCDQCTSVFVFPSCLARHIRTVHEKRRDYACPHCDAAFARAQHRAYHMHAKHPDDNARVS